MDSPAFCPPVMDSARHVGVRQPWTNVLKIKTLFLKKISFFY
jgi:hypothetical protein